MDTLETITGFASTTGFSIAQISVFTKAIMQTYIGAVLFFLNINAAKMIAYGMIFLILLVVIRVFYLYRV